MLNASKSTIGEIISEREEECDNILPKSRRRRQSTSVDKLRSAQSGANELFDSTLPANLPAMKIKTKIVSK